MQKRNKDRDGLYQRTGSPYYWASFVDPRGRRIRRSTGIAVSREGRKEAEALLAKWRLQAHREKQWGEKPRPTFDELMALYLTTVTPHKRDPERDRNSAKRLYPVFTGSLLDEITGPMISQYVNERREVVAAATVNKEIGLLSAAINWANKDLGWEVTNPVLGRRLKPPAGRMRWLTVEEAKALISVAREERKAPHLADFILLALHTGMRKGELLKLEWSRVDWSQSLVYLNAEDQKNGKIGSVPLNAEALTALKRRARFRAEHCPDSRWVFCKKTGGRIQDLKHSFQSACNKVGIEDFHPHDLRHTCAAWLVQSGVPIREVAELLRHSDIQVTMRYAHLSPENVREAVAGLASLTAPNGHIKSQSGHTAARHHGLKVV